MKKLVAVFVLLTWLPTLFAEDLPKDCLGHYAGEMQAYTAIKNDVEMSIQKHDVRIHITRYEITYESGLIEVKGTYTFFKESASQYLIKAKMSNGKNLAYEMDLVWNKKTRTLFLAGKNGEPDVTLEKI